MSKSVWHELRGSTAAERLRRLLAAEEVAHAWLLLGPAGSGKSAVALAMAAALNCPVEPAVGCGECSSCVRILRRRHPDVHHIAPEGPLIPVDVIRELVIPEASRSPFEGVRKVFVLEESDRMNDPAQNALLKTLEEPQPDTVFILISDQEEDLLETVRSRCRILRMEPVPEPRIVEVLQQDGVPETRARLAARLSEGDLGRARSMGLDEAVQKRRERWLSIPSRLLSPVDALDAAAEIIGEARESVVAREAVQKTEVIELAEAMGEGRGTATARTALAKRHRRELRRLEEEVLGEALATLASFYRDVLVLRSGGNDAVVNLDLVGEIESWAETTEITGPNLLAAAERFVQARASLARNANQTLAIESTLLEVAGLIPAATPVTSDW